MTLRRRRHLPVLHHAFVGVDAFQPHAEAPQVGQVLRHKKGDIPALVQHFVAKYAKENEKRVTEVNAAALQLLLDYDWPGNVRELENVIERLVVLAPDVDEAALGAALYNVEWTRQHLDAARVMLLYRAEDLAEKWPDELGEELSTLNNGVRAAIRAHARRRYGESADAAAVRRVVFALVDVPYAAGRRHLVAGEPPPPLVDDLVTETLRRILGIDALP